MGWFDDEDEEAAAPEEVVRADPKAVESAWGSVADVFTDYAASAEQTAQSAYQSAAATASSTYDTASDVAQSEYDSATDFAQSAYDSATDFAQSECDAASGAYDTAATVASDAYDTAAIAAAEVEQEAATELQPAIDYVEDKAEQFAQNAQTQFEADPVKFLAGAGGAPIVDYDGDASDGATSLHIKSVYGTVDTDWQAGRGTEIRGQMGMDWGPSPYAKVDVSIDDQGTITKASGTAKLTIPLEEATAKGEVGATYERHKDGTWTASGVENVGVSVDGVEVTTGLHGTVVDHGAHGFEVRGGPQASVGVGGVPLADGFDIAEAAGKTQTDIGYSNIDGQTTYTVAQTTGVEAKVFGQTIAQGSDIVTVGHTDGPKGERILASHEVTATVGHDAIGKVTVGDKIAGEYGLDGSGNEVRTVTLTSQATVDAPGGKQIDGILTTTTYDDVSGNTTTTEVRNPGQAVPQQPAAAPADGRPLVLTNPDEPNSPVDVITSDGDPVDMPEVAAGPASDLPDWGDVATASPPADNGFVVTPDAFVDTIDDIDAFATMASFDEIEVAAPQPDFAPAPDFSVEAAPEATDWTEPDAIG